MRTLEYAIKMELDGKKYYMEQAELNNDNELKTIFNILAAEEQIHADVLRKRANNEEYVLEGSQAIENAKNVFTELSGQVKEQNNLMKQIDVYRYAIEIEKKSIQLYEEMAKESETDADKELFTYLIAQEKMHSELFGELIDMLRHLEEWVEDAEFGIRDEY